LSNSYFKISLNHEATSKGLEKIAGSKLIIVPKAGHFLKFEKPEAVNKAINEFLKKDFYRSKS
jgi:pimeloyl-ACP methyl ester carboxylesterase